VEGLLGGGGRGGVIVEQLVYSPLAIAAAVVGVVPVPGEGSREVEKAERAVGEAGDRDATARDEAD